MNDDPDLEAITPAGSPPSTEDDGGRRRIVVICVVALLLAALSFAAGRATRSDPAPGFPCGDRVVGVIEANGLPNAVLEVSAPLRPTGPGDGPLPLTGAQVVELAGTATGHQGFRPSGGRLVLAVEVPRSSVGKSADITRGDELVVRVPITSPLCQVDEVQPAATATTEGEKRPDTPDVLYILERFSGSTETPSVLRVVDLAAGTSRKVELPIGPGDPETAMLRRGDKLVFYRGGHVPVDTNVWTVALAELGREPVPLGRARWFLAGPEPDQVWLIEGDGDDISRSAELVDSDGRVLISSTPLPDGYPTAGLADGLVLGTQTGLIRWFADGRPSTALAREPAQVVSATADALLWVPPARDPAELHITALSTTPTPDRVVPLPISSVSGASRGTRFATALGTRAVVVDIPTGATKEFELPIGGISWALDWSDDGKRLYLGGEEQYGSPRLWVWNSDSGQLAELRLDLDGLLDLRAGF